MSKKHKFYTFNILTPQYCYQEKFPNNKKEFLDNKKRFHKIKDIINEKIQEGYIIALQECNRMWESKFRVLFENNNYHMISSLYGTRKNGYMGIVIAYPRDYELLDCKIERLSDTFYFPRRKKISYCQRIMNCLKIIDIEDDSFLDDAKFRFNTLIGIKLKYKEEVPIWVFNYHMPCAWKKPIVMIAHTILLKNYIDNVAMNFNCVLMGDFNSKPKTIQYNILTNPDKIDLLNEYYNIEDYNKLETYNISLKKKISFKSVYKEFYKEEPDCTNYAFCGNNGSFRGTLDYIFVRSPSGYFKVNKVDNLNKNYYLSSYMPNLWPSDHLPIACEIEF